MPRLTGIKANIPKKPKLKFVLIRSNSKQSFKGRTMLNLLNRAKKILPDIWEDYVDIISGNRDQVGDNKGGGGPADKKHGQNAQTLRQPQHLGQMCDLWKSRSAHDKHTCSVYFTSRKVETCGVLPTVTW